MAAKRPRHIPPFEDRIARLEALTKGFSLPGTQLVRVVADVGLLQKHGVDTSGHELGKSVSAWCLRLGTMQDRRVEFYGLSLDEVMRLAETAIFLGRTS